MNGIVRIGILGALFSLFAVSLSGNEGDAIMRRMRDRSMKVEELKLTGLVGEDNRGYLQVRSPLSNVQQGVIENENVDRRKIYFIIGIKSDLKVDQVGSHRASQIAVRSVDGIWLQRQDGTWYQKGIQEPIVSEIKGRKKRRSKLKE
ncbi:MAG: hypothetical protein DF168_00424 [Candidatus Moanabacter tarae]|mgnify:CR=1 FL=1|uniref:DUF1318 domain-containing protein n=1 Tax=Candidatus Moanibacter tarae TaxID=2200854 RepID=A0A2Z4ABC6_9BACT|nr:MAG: hypothetical protein DF168_00424 [Candidatus Moanabacter tarae]|tara:strand:+ start:8489 stop:8929 length:441 start_codon:yes stop_codon:yes gene_type:complete